MSSLQTPAHRQCPESEEQFSPRTQADPVSKHIVIAFFDSVEQAPIGPGHDEENGTSRRQQQGNQRLSGVIKMAGPVYFETHESAKAIIADSLAKLRGIVTKAVEVLAR